jgi:hypothetical protein
MDSGKGYKSYKGYNGKRAGTLSRDPNFSNGDDPHPRRFAGKAAEHRRTPRRKHLMCAGNDGHVLECGGVLPLWNPLKALRAKFLKRRIHFASCRRMCQLPNSVLVAEHDIRARGRDLVINVKAIDQ